jgi:threonine aldolase
MAEAEVGDDVFREDPEAIHLESEVAERVGHEAALFVPSGVMAALVLLRTIAPPGTEVICESDAHLVAFQAGTTAMHAGVQYRTIDGDRGRLDADGVARRLRPPGPQYVTLSAIAVEEATNRGGGAIHGLARLQALRDLADARGIALIGDGARIWNAIVATGADPIEVGRCFTAFSFCLSKGLGAPIGSMVVGDASMIEEARSWRHRFGGAMRQVGALAAAGRYVLRHHVDRLAVDHDNARVIAEVIADAAPGATDPALADTNIVLVETGDRPAALLRAALAEEKVLVGSMGPNLLRLVTHLGVDADGARRAAQAVVRHLRHDVG